MSAPDFKATMAQALQGAQDLVSHRQNWKDYQLDCFNDATAILSCGGNSILTNAPQPGPVLQQLAAQALGADERQLFRDALSVGEEINGYHAAGGRFGAEPVGSVLSVAIAAFWAAFVPALKAWLATLGL